MSERPGAVGARGVFFGYLYIAAATLFWGVSATLGRAVFTGRLLHGNELSSIDPLILSQSRVTFAFLMFLPVLVLTRGWRRLQLRRVDFWRMCLLGILGVAGSNYFYYLAIQRTSVATAITVQYTAPIWVLLYLAVTGLQKLTLRSLVAVGLAILGIVMVVGLFRAGGLRLDLVGILAAVLAAFSFAFYNVSGHNLLARYDHWIVLLYTTFTASAFWMLIHPPWRVVAQHYSARSWAFLGLFSLVSVLAPFSFYIAGLRNLGPTRAVIVSCLEPVFSIVIAAVALRETVGPLQALGIVLVLAAILVVQVGDRKLAPVWVEPIE